MTQASQGKLKVFGDDFKTQVMSPNVLAHKGDLAGAKKRIQNKVIGFARIFKEFLHNFGGEFGRGF